MNTGPAEAHLMIVDGDEQIRTLLQKYLLRNGFWVTMARSAAHARRILSGLEFDLVVLDTRLGDESGPELVRGLSGEIATPILALVGKDADRAAMQEAGARDVLVKPFEPKALLARINAVLDRVAPAETAPPLPRLLQLGPIRYDVDRGEMWRGDEQVRLTATESQLMRIFSARPGEALSRSQLVEDLGRDKGQAQERAVDVQITRLRRKMESDPKAPKYLQTVRGAGYLLAPD